MRHERLTDGRKALGAGLGAMIWAMGPFPERTLLRAAPWPSGAGSERGEVDLDRITPRVAMLPFDLFRRDLLASSVPIPAPAVTELIDDVLLPLGTPDGASGGC